MVSAGRGECFETFRLSASAQVEMSQGPRSSHVIYNGRMAAFLSQSKSRFKVPLYTQGQVQMGSEVLPQSPHMIGQKSIYLLISEQY